MLGKEAVKELRKTLGESQAKFATRLKVSEKTIIRYEAGKFRPTPTTLSDLYFLAKESGREDLLGAIVVGWDRTVVIDQAAGNLILKALPHLQQFCTRAQSILTKVTCDPTVGDRERARLLGELLQVAMEHQKFLSQLSDAAHLRNTHRPTAAAATSIPKKRKK